MTGSFLKPYQINFNTEITYLKGIGTVRAEALKEIDILTVWDLFYHFPRRYLDRRTINKISQLTVKDNVVIIGKIQV